MKNLFMATAAITLMMTTTVLTSCTSDNEDNPSTSNQEAIMVNTAALYDELGIRSEMAQVLASGDYVLTDTLLVYDASGTLVTKLGTESSNLEPLAFNVEGLTDGSYTLVLWQSARTASGDKAWQLIGEEQLSTAILGETRAPIGYAFSAGYASTTVNAATTRAASLVPTLTPMAIGGIVDMRVDNLDAMADATALSLWGTNVGYCTGIRLAPAMDEEGRWYTDPDAKLPGRVAQLPVGQTSGKFFTLYHGPSNAFQLWADKGDDEAYVTHLGYVPLPVGQQSVCYFDMGRQSWQPPFFGCPDDFATWKADRDANIPVTDPLLRWGCSIDDIYDHVFSKTWYQSGNYDLEYWADPFESWHQWYYVSPSALTEQYLFETEDGQNLRYVVCICWDNTVPVEVCYNLLARQGFHATGNTILFDGANNYNQYLSADGQTEALALADSNGWYITYRPFNNQQ
ncbi:MAG: hypothetical protein E7101_12655 [Prevotella ruminicola]|jgi:hypothetical protein|uniref:Lipoprotein n=1 Tax=Xylanibacter ruminicola TaxID=839 RepID=A0A9D5SCG8_XYLRU|nr:hypothetical protein [Xylanibacter ruminicola]